MEDNERYLGGLSSARSSKGPVGYGVFVTSTRLFGVRNWKALGRLMAAAVLSPVAGAIELSRSADEGVKAIEQLEKDNDFVIARTEIASLELCKPGFITNGFLLVTNKSGKRIKIRFSGKKEFETIADLMKTFYPEAIKWR